MAKRVKDPGFGTFSTAGAKPTVNKDGTFNIRHINHRGKIFSAYQHLIDISWGRFFLLVFIGYLTVNIVFASLYLLTGIEGIIPSTGVFYKDFINAFFFSAQTVTTVGYGAMAPKGLATGIISTFEALVGLLSFSFVTGLLYGRFARPKASIGFSEHVVYRPFKDGNAIMFRLMNKRTKVMIRPKVKVILSISESNEVDFSRSFFELKLERETVTYLPTTWTIVHEIGEGSPLFKYTPVELSKLNSELLILISYYDDVFNQEVHQVHSYMMNELLIDHQFEKAFYFAEDGTTVLDHRKLSSTVKMER